MSEKFLKDITPEREAIIKNIPDNTSVRTESIGCDEANYGWLLSSGICQNCSSHFSGGSTGVALTYAGNLIKELLLVRQFHNILFEEQNQKALAK